MNARRSMQSLPCATLALMLVGTSLPALAGEPGSEPTLTAALARAAADTLSDGELGALRGGGWLSDTLAAVINSVPTGYTATAQVGGTTVGQIGSPTPVTIPTTTIGGTTLSASATTGTGSTSSSFTSTQSSTSTSTRTFSFSFSQ